MSSRLSASADEILVIGFVVFLKQRVCTQSSITAELSTVLKVLIKKPYQRAFSLNLDFKKSATMKRFHKYVNEIICNKSYNVLKILDQYSEQIKEIKTL